MKAKVQLTDSYSGRNINVIVNLENIEGDRYDFVWSCLSDYQRKKIENYFGSENAYHTTPKVINIY